MDDGLALAVHRGRSKIRFEMTNEDGDKIVLIFEGSKLAKLARVISKYFPATYFTSREAVEAYISCLLYTSPSPRDS